MDDQGPVNSLSPSDPLNNHVDSSATIDSTPSPEMEDFQDLTGEQQSEQLPASPVSSKRAREYSLETDLHPAFPREDNATDSDDEALERTISEWMPLPKAMSLDHDPFKEPVPALQPDAQLKHIETFLNGPITSGSVWYVIAKGWYERWRQYCSRMASSSPQTRELGSRAPPGPIDNSPILTDNKTLKDNLVVDQDFVIVPSDGWDCLSDWYGSATPAIERYAITEGEHIQQTIVEIYPPVFTLYLVSSQSTTIERPPRVTLSRQTTVAELMSTLANAMDLQSHDEFQLWQLPFNFQSTQGPRLNVSSLQDAHHVDLSHTEYTLAALCLTSGAFAIEVKNRQTGEFPSDKTLKQKHRQSDVSSVSSASSISTYGLHSLTATSDSPPVLFGSSTPNMPNNTGSFGKSATRVKGVCGLSNLGNTCFMNAALQCLSNTPQLSAYFLSGEFKNDVNRENPLGMKGQVAEAYGALIEKLWNGTATSFGPRDFKFTIGRFNPTFSGYMQHDSQELLAFLLDGLHEDLNRILKKPYMELPDFDGMPDREIAEKSWSYHKARNDSIIVDLFQGQFKSRLTCKECNKVSVTFDPFMYLSLPLPIQKKSKIEVVFVPYDPALRPVRMFVTIKKNASIKQLRDETARLNQLEDPSTLLVTEIFDDKIYKVFPLYEPVANIGQSDLIYIYEVPGPVPPPPKKKHTPYRFGRNGLHSDDSDNSDEDTADQQETNPDQLIVFPVYSCKARNEDTNETYADGQFGGPTLVAIKRKDATHPDQVYREIARQVERYACMKLFEEVRQTPSPDPMDTGDVADTGDNDDTGTAKDMTDEAMDVDSPAAQIQQQPIHTAAAVTAAGGRRMEPMRNLFVMRPFKGTSYSSDSELFPVSMSSSRGELEDLYTRAEREDQQRKAYQEHMVEYQNSMTGLSPSPAKSTENDKREDEDQEEMVEDASKSYGVDAGLTTIANTVDTPASQQKPVKKPPSTVIRQGEGIIIEWSIKRAQQVFGKAPPKQLGTPRKKGFGIQVDAWSDVDVRKEPAESENPTAKKQITLSDCLDEFTREEELSEEDLWYCPRCKKHQRASKKFDLWKLPEIVVVHLKRFSHTRIWRDKIDAFIDFPVENLDMTDRVLSVESPENLAENDRYIYDLYGVDNHYGGLGGGHYTAFGQNWHDHKWYNFDDSHVSQVNRDDVKTSAAYVLFYKRRRPTEEPNTSN